MPITRRNLFASASVLAVPNWLTACATAPLADMVLLGGEIHTVDNMNRRVPALAIANGKILAVGQVKDMERLSGPQTRRVDLEGRTVLPGINDSHLHLIGWALSQPPYSIDVTFPTVKSIANVVEAVRLAVATRPVGEWIIGRGWDQPYLNEGRAPTAADLDAVSPNNPVMLTEFSGHAVWVNSKAMELAGVASTTGLFFENAAFALRKVVPPPTTKQTTEALVSAMQKMLQRGITSATDPMLDPAEIQIYRDIASDQSIAKLRMQCLLTAGESEQSLRDTLQKFGSFKSTDKQWMHTPGIKIMGDGIPTGNKTAWLNEPYQGGGNGSLLMTGDTHEERVAQLNAMIALAHSKGLQVGTHTTGDRSIDEAVAAYTRVQQDQPNKDLRHYLIHADLVSEATLAQMAAQDIGANFNPEIKHLIADSQVHSIGPIRASYEWPYHSALEAGVKVSSSSDAPVTAGNWLQGLATCLERRGKQTGQVSGPEQRINLDQAIRTYTKAPAWQDHADTYKGSLEPGKVADLTVLDERLSAVPPTRFTQAKVVMTILEGDVVHE